MPIATRKKRYVSKCVNDRLDYGYGYGTRHEVQAEADASAWAATGRRGQLGKDWSSFDR